MSRLFTGISQLVSPAGTGARRGPDQAGLTVIENAAFRVEDGVITRTGSGAELKPEPNEEVTHLEGRAVVPGLVDPHTHAVWAGDRLGDFDARARGLGYEDILRRGGGIRSTIRATAQASRDELAELAVPRLRRLVASGATTIEIKSGYGFTVEAELRMLEAIRSLARRTRARLVPTLLIHVPPQNEGERSSYLDMVTSELLPEAARRGLATSVDVFTEREAFSVSETERVLIRARQLGLSFKLHADQFHAIGGSELAVWYGALSVDHLEASGPDQIGALAVGNTVATVLPGVTLHLGLRAAPGRALIDAGVPVAVGTDLNPGSSPLASTSLAQALAVRINGLTPAEALTAGTANAASAIGLERLGRIEAGSPADFLVLDGPDWRMLSYALGGSAVAETWIAGEKEES